MTLPLVLTLILGCEQECGKGEASYVDADGDGFGGAEAACGDAGVAVAGDCDDADPGVSPGALEDCDGVDDDCDGVVDEADGALFADADGDGFGDPETPVAGCEETPGAVADGTDCDDADPTVHPQASEVCDGDDEDCDGAVDESGGPTRYLDADGDGYGDAAATTTACEPGEAYVDSAEDCDDASASVNPASAETCNGQDDDCDGLVDGEDADVTGTSAWYPDGDGDGYGASGAASTEACEGEEPEGYVATNGDCDDADPDVWPGWGNADMDCDGRPGTTIGIAHAVLLGSREGEEAGVVLSHHDVDGDGSDELFLGTGYFDDGPGWTYVVPGGQAEAGGTVAMRDLATRIEGREDGDGAGSALLWIDDVDGDALDELVLSAPLDDAPGTNGGALLLVTGAELASAQVSATKLPLTDDHEVALGESAGEVFSFTLAGLGDISGDGAGDLLVSAPRYGGLTGKVYLISGAELGNGEASAFSVVEGVGDEYLGTTIGRDLGGDLDGDGVPEVVVSAGRRSSDGTATEGGVYVFLGADLSTGGTFSTADAATVWQGTQSGGFTGHFTCVPGDLTGDGVDDIALSVTIAGRVYLVDGSDALAAPVSSVEDAWVRLRAESGGIYPLMTTFGYALDAADLDADGRPDLLVGDPVYSEWAVEDDAGRAYAFRASSLTGGTIAAEDADAIFNAPDAWMELGASLSGAGDVDGDGTEDLLIGSRGDGTAASAGRTWLLLSPW